MYEEHEEIYEEFCKHQEHLFNQGITFCNAGLDLSKCNDCKLREPVKHICKVAACTSM